MYNLSKPWVQHNGESFFSVVVFVLIINLLTSTLDSGYGGKHKDRGGYGYDYKPKKDYGYGYKSKKDYGYGYKDGDDYGDHPDAY